MSFNDALMYSQMQNVMTQDKDYDFWRQANITGIDANSTKNEIDKKLNVILSNTTLKRACCLEKPEQKTPPDKSVWQIDVRLPVPNIDKFQKSTEQQLGPPEKLYNYYDKAILIPKTLCNSVVSSDGSKTSYSRPKMGDNKIGTCDVFYNTYCSNVKRIYEEQSNKDGRKPNDSEFALSYKNECSCFAYPSPKVNTSKRCLLYPGCTSSTNNVYLDNVSRKTCPENITICNQEINLAEASIGGRVAIESKFEQACGNNNAGDESESGITPMKPSGSSENIPSSGTPSGGTPSGGTPSGGTPSGGTPSSGTPSGGTPSGGTPSGGTPSGGSEGSASGETSGSEIPSETSGGTSSKTSSSSSGISNETIYIIVGVVLLLLILSIVGYFVYRHNKKPKIGK